MSPFLSKKQTSNAMDYLNKLTKNSEKFQQYTMSKFRYIVALEESRQELKEYTCEKAIENEQLNRYYNILPYDKNCVELKDRRLGKNDYINASFIVPPFNIPRYYIAAQGPLRHTIVDFWHTIVEYEVPLIVCLTPETEKELEKCARYWPDGEKELIVKEEEVMVKLKNVEKERLFEDADCIIRHISVEFYNQNELVKQTSVIQLQFLGWPDHGVPSKPHKLISLIKLARTYYKDRKPTLVHCSAGCGRTGTFCVIDSAEVLSKTNNITFDPVYCLTDEFRKQRTTMVQTQSQYNFCYTALKEFLKDTTSTNKK
ncbi:hypothetical protein CU097_012546 [Rhizopus azygosporus]|uniref:Uncharacterized protein n=1 Tax=Rhizopus azygosporus TaxID=86630 RepID=A0A367KFT6_RHIAZ|nr:hypothetical protein CU097_012546 [Rhizopus azygosporus]